MLSFALPLVFASLFSFAAAFRGLFDSIPAKDLSLERVKAMPVPENANKLLVYTRANHPPLPTLLHILKNWPVDVNAVSEDGKTALYYATRAQDFDALHALLSRGAIVTRECLLTAIYYQNFELLQLLEKFCLLSKGDFCFLMERTAAVGNAEVVKFLLDLRPDIDLAGRGNVLNGAASHGHDNTRVIKMLLERNADIGAVDQLGQNCLFKALRFPDPDDEYCNLIYLLEAAGDRAYELMTVKDVEGKCVLDFLDYERTPEHVWTIMQEIEEVQWPDNKN